MSLLLVAPCRLHFGLFHVPTDHELFWPNGQPVRKYGGLGLMIEHPSVTLRAVKSAHWGAVGSLASRALRFVERFPNHEPHQLTVDGPPEHVGLGVGTALGMCVGYCLRTKSLGRPGCSISLSELGEIARTVERGRRSGIGVHGFHTGGFLVDDGKLEQELPRIRKRIPYPDEWRIVLALPRHSGEWHGPRELAAFHRWRSDETILDTTSRLHGLADHEIIPALERQDFDNFARHLTIFNRIAGEPFQLDQGGIYGSPHTRDIIDGLLNWGVLGAGQSSWGPTVYALARNMQHATTIQEWLTKQFASVDVVITRGDNRGLSVQLV